MSLCAQTLSRALNFVLRLMSPSAFCQSRQRLLWCICRPAGSTRHVAGGIKQQASQPPTMVAGGEPRKRVDELPPKGRQESQSRNGEGRSSISGELQAMVDAERRRRSIVDLLPLFLNKIRSVSNKGRPNSKPLLPKYIQAFYTS